MSRKCLFRNLLAVLFAFILTLSSGFINLPGGMRSNNSSEGMATFSVFPGNVLTATGTSITVNTNNVYEQNGYIYMNGSYTGNANVTQRGFVYSYTNTDPRVGESGTTSLPVSGTSNSFNTSISVNRSYSMIYVKAYATVNGVHYYGGRQSASFSSAGSPTVRTVSVEEVYVRGADIRINVTNQGSSSILERGVAYSTSNNTPTTSDSTRSVSGTTGYATVNLSNLSTDTKYYVRAYARNSNGTSYGETLSFDTRYPGSGSGSSSSSNIETRSVTNIGTTTAKANGYVNYSGGYSIRERGFVYSSSNRYPTLSNTAVYDTSSSLGSYSYNLTGLTKNTTYYLRAYIRTSYDTYYGNVVSFKTTNSDTNTGTYNISILYKTADGTVIGTQYITANYDQKLSTGSLTLPSGYRLQNSSWSYTVSGNDTVSIYVTSNSGTITPTPTVPGGNQVSTEAPFMPYAGSYVFKPDQNLNRGEAAQILYNLSNKVKGTQTTAFSDISESYYKSAIEYVASTGYMHGYPDGTFKPSEPITRAEIAEIIRNFYQLSGTATSNFSDVDSSHWAYNAISLATQAGIVHGYPEGTYMPNRNITRAEAATLFVFSEKRSQQPLSTYTFQDVPTSHYAYNYIMNSAIPSN